MSKALLLPYNQKRIPIKTICKPIICELYAMKPVDLLSIKS